MREPSGLEFSTKSERVAAIIRNKITLGEYAPRQRLLQQHLADEIGVSETPVREALNQLRAEGLVVIEAHRGARVADAPEETVHETCLIRRTLEQLAVSEGIPRISQEAVSKLVLAHRRMTEAAEQGDRAAVVQFNRMFHFSVYQASEMPQLVELIRVMWSRLPAGSTLFRPGRLTEVLREHAAVLDAIRAGESDRAVAAMVLHVHKSLGTLDQCGAAGDDQAATSIRTAVRPSADLAP